MINKILNRKDETFVEFLKKYWWIEFLALGKVIVFVDNSHDNWNHLLRY